MRLVIRAVALWLCMGVGAFAQVGMGTVPTFVTPGAASLPPVTLTFQANGRSTPSGTTETYSITFLSALAANQRVVVFGNSSAFDPAGFGPLVSAVFTPNIGSPVTATVTNAGEDTSQHFTSFAASAVMPTGATSVTLILTFTNSGFGGTSYGVYTLNDAALSSSTPTFTFVQTTTSPLSGSIATPAGSALIASFFNFGTSSSGWTAGVTSDTGGVAFSNDFGHVSNATASASYTVTNTWTVSGSGNPDLTLWVYR